MNKPPLTVLVADDHPLVRDALVRTLRGAMAVHTVLEAEDWSGVERALNEAPVELALVDLHMPGMKGLEGLRRLRQAWPQLVVVVASGDDDPATIRQALAMGARGFLPKAEPAEVLVQALTLVAAGGTYIPAGAMVGLSVGATSSQGSGQGVGNNAAGAISSLATTSTDTPGLTPRQLDVLRCLARGLPNKLIARELALTEGTVKIHIAAILRVLQARNRTEAVVRAREAGLSR